MATDSLHALGYDANSNIIAKRNRSGQTVTFGFDDLNRETTRTVPANSLGHYLRTLTTSYDLGSRKWDASVTESPLASQTIAHRYDAAGRVDYVTDSFIGASNLIDYAYDPAGNRTLMTWPGGGSVSYSFDALNRMDVVTDSSGVQLADYDWDTLSRRDLVRFNDAGFTADLGYESDDDLSSLIHTGPAPLTLTLLRNHASQITSVTASDGAFLSRPASTLSDIHVPNKLNQIQTLNATPLTYDANGNLTADGTYTFEYDEENRLRSAIGAGFTTAYEYDPLGRRRAKSVNGVTTKFVSDGQEEIEERDGTNAVLRKYAYGSTVDDRIAIFDLVYCPASPSTKSWCFYLGNWQGSTTTLIKRDNSMRDVYHYGPYGEGSNWTPADALTGNPFRYTGRRVDPETGLYYYRARYYSPRLGRFLQTDPIGTRDDLNLYAYALNDAVNRVDPLGDDSFVRDGRIYIEPVDKSVPRVNLPNNVGAAGVSSSGLGPFHLYNVRTPTRFSGYESARAVGSGLQNNPTPGHDRAATPRGTVNNVGVLPTMGDTNLVRSYSIASPDPERFTDITVNYTIAGEHGAHEGFVMRFGEIGPDGKITLRSYGEGNAWRQTQALQFIWGSRVKDAWQKNAGEVQKQVCTGSRIPREQC